MRHPASWLLPIALVAAQEPTAPPPVAYDPMSVPANAEPVDFTFTIHDAERDRDLPVKVFLPAGQAPAPVVLFSHGLGGTRDTCNYLGEHWSRRGYAVVFVQHPGSDDSVWRGQPLGQRMAKMKGAASGQNLVLRCQDVSAVLDRLAAWNVAPKHECEGRLDLEHVGMSGHSFGAMTTQYVSGQSAPLVGQRWLDVRIDAAIPMSPSAPLRGDLAAAFAKVPVPWLCMTGTLDAAPIGDQTAESRQCVYPNLPATIDRYELVLDGAEHSAFTERALPGDRQQRNSNHHRAILALSTAFWDAYLRDDAAALEWLQGDAAKAVLEEHDRWQIGQHVAVTSPPHIR